MCWNFLSGRLFWFSVSLVSLYTMHLKERQYWHIVPLCFFAINFLWVLINHPHSNAKGKANRCILSRSENHLISALRISLAIIKFYFSPSYLKRYFSSVPPYSTPLSHDHQSPKTPVYLYSASVMWLSCVRLIPVSQPKNPMPGSTGQACCPLVTGAWKKFALQWQRCSFPYICHVWPD